MLYLYLNFFIHFSSIAYLLHAIQIFPPIVVCLSMFLQPFFIHRLSTSSYINLHGSRCTHVSSSTTRVITHIHFASSLRYGCAVVTHRHHQQQPKRKSDAAVSIHERLSSHCARQLHSVFVCTLYAEP